MSNRNPKYLNKVMLTKQKIADHEYTVLYDRQGNKYLKLETFKLDTTPRIDFDRTPDIDVSHAFISKGFWGLRTDSGPRIGGVA